MVLSTLTFDLLLSFVHFNRSSICRFEFNCFIILFSFKHQGPKTIFRSHRSMSMGSQFLVLLTGGANCSVTLVSTFGFCYKENSIWTFRSNTLGPSIDALQFCLTVSPNSMRGGNNLTKNPDSIILTSILSHPGFCIVIDQRRCPGLFSSPN